MMRLSVRHRRRDQRGVIALIVAFLSLALMMAAAFAIDVGMQTNRQQNLHASLDAAAQAGAYQLPTDTTAARADALSFVQLHDSSEAGANTPNVDFWCVLASTGTAPNYVVDSTQIPGMCHPGNSTTYNSATYPGMRCGPVVCALPCGLAMTTNLTCNTIRVFQGRDVPFTFARVGGFSKGSTGALSSVACKGPCGTIAPNPMDVAVVADRTGSMSSTDIASMIAGIKSMLQVMTPSIQYVALGTIGRSKTGATDNACGGSNKALTEPSTSATTGPWIPVPFSNDYLTGTTLNANSPLVRGVTCLSNSSGTGTHLASPLKAAARYLLGMDANNLTSLPPRPGVPQKAIIFETDGQPNESITGGTTTLGTGGDIGAGGNGDTACSNMTTVANQAKAQNILVVTVAYNLGTTKCGSSGTSPTVASKLAEAASPKSSSPLVPSIADSGCSTTAERTAENSDGDFFFCAASGDNLAPLFKTAFGQLSTGIRLINLP